MMRLIILSISRAVPFLLMMSLVLVAGRFLHDRFASASRFLARTVFALALFAGLLLTTPYVMRSVTLVRAQRAVLRRDPARAAHLYQLYQDLGGTDTRSTRAERIRVQLALHRFAEAEALLLGTLRPKGGGRVEATPDDVVFLGISRYHQGKTLQAEKTLRAVPTGHTSHLRDYYLGRLAERRGDRVAAADLYRAALVAQPRFYPPLEQLTRILQANGDAATAHRLIERFLTLSPDEARASSVLERLERGQAIPETEFTIVEI